ncbi:MAG TPA: hypothetical protein VJT78_09405 [Candidatus Dormibacteraeota bacterium]|nr:hypothetical protein [Candidatus Dormibacteraeota bacterium]
MLKTDAGTGPGGREAPRWVGWTLVVGAVLLLAWAWFVYGFLAEPSAVGRSRILLDWLVGSAIGSAIAAVVAAAGSARRARWAWGASVFAAAVMVVTCAGAVIGIPVLLGLIPTRRSS